MPEIMEHVCLFEACQRNQLSGHTCFVDKVERESGSSEERQADQKEKKKVDAPPLSSATFILIDLTRISDAYVNK